MEKGWIKLYRKMLDNPFLMSDPTARHVFVTLLLLADRKTGTWSGGSRQLGTLVGMKWKTVYEAIRRAERQLIIERIPNTKFTVIRICKWHEYQGDGALPVERSMNDQFNSNKKEKKKEKEKNTITPLSLLNISKYQELKKGYAL